MRIKDGVKIQGMSNEMLIGMMVVDTVLPTFGQEVVLTCGVDGTHKVGSAHYRGDAGDFRTWDLQTPEEAVRALKAALGSDFDIVLHRTHLHVEYDPKTGVNL